MAITGLGSCLFLRAHSAGNRTINKGRKTMEGVFIPIVVFLLVYAAISFGLINKAVAALLGVMILLVLHVIDEHTAVEFNDFETIMLLLGMMTIVAIFRKSGFFTISNQKNSPRFSRQ
jgi:Na+/H+ antiporter NhaD/arsenite permease-like protein